MPHVCFQSRSIGSNRPVFAVIATLSLLAGGVSLVAVPVIQSAEASESGAPKERCEDPTLTARFEHDRLHALERRVAAFAQSARPSLGHAQRPVLLPLPGHRLANGLLAPMTC
jgi:hypothetical protein